MHKSSGRDGHKATGEILSVHEAAKAMMLPKMGRSKHSVSFYAAALDEPESTLYQWGDGRVDMPAKKLVPLTLASGDFLMLDSMEAAVGRVAIPLPTGEDLELWSIRRAVKEFSETVEAACEALEDGVVDSEELARVEKEGREAIAAIHQLMSEFKAREETARLTDAAGDGRAQTLAAAEAAKVGEASGRLGTRGRVRPDVH